MGILFAILSNIMVPVGHTEIVSLKTRRCVPKSYVDLKISLLIQSNKLYKPSTSSDGHMNSLSTAASAFNMDEPAAPITAKSH